MSVLVNNSLQKVIMGVVFINNMIIVVSYFLNRNTEILNERKITLET